MNKYASLAVKYGLHPLHAALIDIVSLQERVDELEKELGRPFVMERGPWVTSEDGKHLYSDDFTHDVTLIINGDFAEEDRLPYAKELARRLNTFSREPRTAPKGSHVHTLPDLEKVVDCEGGNCD